MNRSGFLKTLAAVVVAPLAAKLIPKDNPFDGSKVHPLAMDEVAGYKDAGWFIPGPISKEGAQEILRIYNETGHMMISYRRRL